MAEDVPLYNLAVGKDLAHVGKQSASVGGWQLSLTPNYCQAMRSLPTGPAILNGTHVPGNDGTWVQTAVATRPDGVAAEQSLLLVDGTRPDNGLSDILTLLTFLNGRNVVDTNGMVGYLPLPTTLPAAHPEMLFQGLESAWRTRANLAGSKAMALHLHNESLRHDSFQVAGLIEYTALDILLGQEQLNPTLLPPQRRAALRFGIGVATWLSCVGTPSGGSDWRNYLISKIDAGLIGQTEKLTNLLSSIGVLTADELQDRKVLGRISYLNKVRNGIVHQGMVSKRLPKQFGARLVQAVVKGMIPAIVILSILHELRVAHETWNYYWRDHLHNYLLNGIWLGWPLETVEFRGWVSNEYGINL
ncbi:hypothetical protein IIA79_04135 [bacterium]|nr:hypothetical protein [bacterium]